MAIKVANEEKLLATLREEFELYNRLTDKVKTTYWGGPIILTPTPVKFFLAASILERDLHISIPLLTAEKDVCCAFAMEMIRPINTSRWLQIPGADTRQPGLARLYLGVGLINPPHDEEELVPVGYETAQILGIDVTMAARELGRLVAHLNFVLRIDPHDVEILLGARDPPGTVGVYLIDLSDVQQYTKPQTSAYVLSLLGGYVPRPGSLLWSDFQAGYLDNAAALGEEKAASEVILACMALSEKAPVPFDY